MNRRSFFLKRALVLLCCAALCIVCAACMASDEGIEYKDVPQIPERLERSSEGIPVLRVYNTKTGTIEEMDLESYIMGVVAGEMRNDWPMEALKAQAILARTFTMKFLSEKSSRYTGADISTDVHEAQAYDADAVNERVREAVNDTRGEVMISDNAFAHAWFHAHAGGRTELPTKALEYNTDPAYLKVVDSPDSDQAPAEVKNWTASFSFDEIRDACAALGFEFGDIESVKIGKQGESGRAISFLINGKEVSAPSFRLKIGASKLKSTLISKITMDGSGVSFTGSGFGHGVGMSQWGAYAMAQEGSDAEEIIEHYYRGVEITELW